MAAQKGTPNGRDHSLTFEPNPPEAGVPENLNVTFVGPNGSKGIEIFVNGMLAVTGTSDATHVAVSIPLGNLYPGDTLVIEYFNQDENYEPITLQLR